MTTVAARPIRIPYNPELLPPRSCWPDDVQTLLLQACLCGKEQATEAFLEWDRRVDVLKMDHGSNRLMALLFRNLERHGIRGSHYERLKGNWRYHWCQNKLLLGGYRELSRMLDSADIPHLALKGIPLGLFYYRDMGVRPMSDFDILVRPDRVRETVSLFRDHGYEPKSDWERNLAYSNGCGFVKKGATEIDLHWHVLHDCFYRWSDDAFWEGSEKKQAEGMSCRTLCAEDHLLHACAHGMRYNKIPPLRWLADAWAILQDAGDRMDYDRLEREAERRQLASPVKRTFDYFEKHHFFSSGHPACQMARHIQVSFYEKLEYPYRIHPSENLPSYVPLWFQYQRWKHAGDFRSKGKGFLAYYAERRRLSGCLAAVVYLIKNTFKRSFFQSLKSWMRDR